MNTNLSTKTLQEISSGHKSVMVVLFYLLTFLTGGFFLFSGSRVGIVVDLTAAVFYVAVTILFYALSKT